MIVPDTDGLIGEAEGASLNGGKLSGEPIGEIAGPFAGAKVFKNISNISFLP